MVADEGLAIAVNVIGDPATPTLVELPTETEMAVGFVMKKTTTLATTMITITTIAALILATACLFIDRPSSCIVRRNSKPKPA
jgi:hypothetical protein